MAEGEEGGEGGPGAAEVGGGGCGLAAGEMGTEAAGGETQGRFGPGVGATGLPPPEGHRDLGLPRPRILAPSGCAASRLGWGGGCGREGRGGDWLLTSLVRWGQARWAQDEDPTALAGHAERSSQPPALWAER